MSHLMQGVYAPLPQSLSDSDSEKEISMDPICPNYKNDKNSHFDSNYMNGKFDMHHSNTNEIIKIKSTSTRNKMSTKRKIAFIISIIMCFLPIVVFIFILPCSELSTCPVKISNWAYYEANIELLGGISVVSGLYKTTMNLAIPYRGAFNSHKLLKNGIVSLMGSNGAVAWDFGQEVVPWAMNCSIIDVDNNGNMDCLVIDERGLKAIETVSGQRLWHANSEDRIINNLQMPIPLPDYNKDNTKELLSICRKRSLLLLNGKNGKALANIKLPTKCSEIMDLRSDVSKKSIIYTCKNDSNLSFYSIPFIEIRKSYKLESFVVNPTRIDLDPSFNVYISGKRRLVVDNDIKCFKCSSTITLYDTKDVLLRNWTYKNSFIMNPKPFSFVSKKSNLGYVNGFIVKIWEWHEYNKNLFRKRDLSTVNETSYYLSEIIEKVILITFNDTDVHVINASLNKITQICYQRDTINGDDCQPSHVNQKDSLLVADLDHDGNQEMVNYYSYYDRKGEEWQLASYLEIFRLEDELLKFYGSK